MAHVTKTPPVHRRTPPQPLFEAVVGPQLASLCSRARSVGVASTPGLHEHQHHSRGRCAEPAVECQWLEPLLSIKTLAEYVGVPVVTIYRWRTEGKGPCAVRVGKHLKFALSDVQAWLTTVRETAPGVQPERR